MAVRTLSNAQSGNAVHLKLKYVSFHGIAEYLQFGHGNGKLESTRAGTSRIDVEHAITIFYRRLVRMARHYHVKAGRHGIDIQIGQIVQDVDEDFTDLKDFRF